MNCTVPKGDEETCKYECLPGYGVNNSVYFGTVTCDMGTFVFDQPTACPPLPATIQTTPRPVYTPRPTTTKTTTTTTTKEGEMIVEVTKIVSSMVITQVLVFLKIRSQSQVLR